MSKRIRFVRLALSTIAWSCVLATSAAAQCPAKTTIADTLYNADGSLASGRVTIAWPTFLIGSCQVIAGQTTVTVANGTFSVQLYPNTSSSPSGTSYRATFALKSGRITTEYWVVPATAASVALATVRAPSVPVPAVMLGQAQVTNLVASLTRKIELPSPCPSGKVLESNGSSTPPQVNCVDPSGGSGPQHQVNGTNLASNNPVNFQDTASIAFTNTGAGNVQAAIKDGAVTAAKLAVSSPSAVQLAGVGDNNIVAAALSPNRVVGTAVTQARAINTTSPIAGGGDLSADRTLTCNVASGAQPGCLASADWTTFNNSVDSVSGTAEEIASTGGQTPVLSLPSILNLATKTLKGGSPLLFDGVTADANKTTLVVTDPTAARNFTLPNADSVAVQPDAGAANNFLTAISTLGVVSKAQPAFSNLSGSATAGQVPNLESLNGILTAAKGGTGANNAATAGRYLRADGTNYVISSVAAAGAGSCTNQFVRATVDNAAPTCATVAKADAAATFAHTDQSNTYSTGAQDFESATVTRPFRRLAFASFPVTCTANREFIERSDPAAAGQVVYVCNAAGNGWDLVGDGGAGGGLGDPGANGVVVRTALNTTVARSITGTTGNVTVTNGDGVAGNPTLDLGLTAVQTDQANTFGAFLQDFAASTARIPNAATLPATCALGEIYADNNETPAGQQVYFCSATNTWSKIGDGGGGGGITSLNTLTAATQTFATPGTAGTAPAWSSVTNTHTLNIPLAATASVTAGLLSRAQYDIFDGKVGAARAISTTAPLAGGGDLSADRTLTCNVASGSQPGCLASADWTTFNGKPALVTAGSVGTAAVNAGTATTAARSDHEHNTFLQLSWYFPGVPSAAVQTAVGVFPEGISGISITDMRVTVNTTSAATSAVNIQRCTASCTGTGPTFAAIYSTDLSLAANTRTVARGSAPNQNVSGLAGGDQFRVNLVTVGASLADVTVTMTYRVKNTN